MTTELEEQFFKTFGIEPIPIKSYGNWLIKGFIAENDKGEKVVYPEITAEKLLQLLCIVIDEYNRDGRTFYLDSTNVKELKEGILDALMGCIDTSCDLFEIEVKQIQQLFKEEE